MDNNITQSTRAADRLRAANYLVLAAIFALLIWQVFKPASQWEYRRDTFTDQNFTRELNRYGEQGWELIFTRRSVAADESKEVTYEMIFKRPKS
jgi:hypothetical protein